MFEYRKLLTYFGVVFYYLNITTCPVTCNNIYMSWVQSARPFIRLHDSLLKECFQVNLFLMRCLNQTSWKLCSIQYDYIFLKTIRSN